MKNFLLLIAAIVLLSLLMSIAVLCSIVLIFIKDSRERYTNPSIYVFSIAYSIDMLGNVICGDLFNVTLIKHGGYCFGKIGETVSSALGKNQQGVTLTTVGKILVRTLDFFEKDHCLKSIQ